MANSRTIQSFIQQIAEEASKGFLTAETGYMEKVVHYCNDKHPGKNITVLFPDPLAIYATHAKTHNVVVAPYEMKEFTNAALAAEKSGRLLRTIVVDICEKVISHFPKNEKRACQALSHLFSYPNGEKVTEEVITKVDEIKAQNSDLFKRYQQLSMKQLLQLRSV